MSLDNIPVELQQLNQWVVVSADSKIPLDAKTGQAASSTNPDTWSDFETAKKVVKDGLASYVGFVFADNGVVGIDVDLGYDEDGFLSQIACKIIRACGSYTEKSKSGRDRKSVV